MNILELFLRIFSLESSKTGNIKDLQQAITAAMTLFNDYQPHQITEIQNQFTLILHQLNRLGLLYVILDDSPTIEQISPPCEIIRHSLMTLKDSGVKTN